MDMKKIKLHLYEIVFEADTRAGKIFDVMLLVMVLLSVITVLLESIERLRFSYGDTFDILEWVFTVVFSLEYLLRLFIVNRKRKYVLSFYGIIDLLAILPKYFELLFPVTAHSLLIIRSLRLLRVFRIFKLPRFVSESYVLLRALHSSRQKIGVFFFFIIMLIFVLGTVMYLVESKESGFTSIPQSIYWAIVTLTTVGYGDIAPVTALGQFIAGAVMILGYAIIAVPTGIITSEMGKHPRVPTTQVCPECLREGHDTDAIFCKFCGAEINPHCREN